MAQGKKTNPEIRWDGKKWFVTLPVEHGRVLEANWNPGLTYVVSFESGKSALTSGVSDS